MRKKKLKSLPACAVAVFLCSCVSLPPLVEAPQGEDWVVYRQGYHKFTGVSTTSSNSYSTVQTTHYTSSMKGILEGESLNSEEKPVLGTGKNINEFNTIVKNGKE